MVVATVPLWVLHSSSKTDSSSIESKASSLLGNATKKSNSRKIDKVKESLSLLQEKNKRCAIYAVDIAPNSHRFATAGGDGLVKIWDSSALFGDDSKTNSSKNKGGHFLEDAGYVSTSAEEDFSDEDDEKYEEMEQQQSDTLTHTQDDPNNNTNISNNQNVNDLSNLVRRKKSGTTNKVPTPASRTMSSNDSKPAAASVVPPAPQATRKQLLATLSAHSGSSVLAVRFSNNGKYLASAGDDGCVCVYAQTSQPAFGADLAAGEHWNRIRLCRGHNLDALGLAWAPDDSQLVSCSLDKETPIIVWNMNDLDQNPNATIASPMHILGKNEHTSTVKGVTFDPAGSFLASSGDDPAVCIWRTHDDWGLEQRIDAASGIFRRWQSDSQQGSTPQHFSGAALSSNQSLFRRISWSTDGSYILSTNAMVKNKHVASTISRDGWAVSGSGTSTAADLVGHKHPVVACRHAPRLLDARPPDANDESDENEEPEYATLLALGDKRGFVTVWSTRKARPLFKIQCGESRWAVTDLAWGIVPNSEDLMLLVSLVEGTTVVLRFNVPDELGLLLASEDQSRVFQLRYGIDMDEAGSMRRSRLFASDRDAPSLIETALQMTLERDDDETAGQMAGDTSDDEEEGTNDAGIRKLDPHTIKGGQKVTTTSGQKRVVPLLMKPDTIRKKIRVSLPSKEKKSCADLDVTVEAVKRADELGGNHISGPGAYSLEIGEARDAKSPAQFHASANSVESIRRTLRSVFTIPHKTDKRFISDLPTRMGRDSEATAIPKFECINAKKKPMASRGAALPCVCVALYLGDQKAWEDEIQGTSCTALSTCHQLAAVGTLDGIVQLYGTSPSVGWACGRAFRSHPAMVFGQTIVSLQIMQHREEDSPKLLVVTADGAFGVYSLLPDVRLDYKGSVLPAFTHMSLACVDEHIIPSLSRIQITDTGQLFLLLSFDTSQRQGHSQGYIHVFQVPGGSIQGFVYQRESEMWIKVTDSRFVLSDFFFSSSLNQTEQTERGVLFSFDEAVRLGSVNSSLKPSNQHAILDSTKSSILGFSENMVCTRAHCEDRLACSVALGSAVDFRHWMALYARVLALNGEQDMIRILVDMMLGMETVERATMENSPCWWLSSAPSILELDRKDLLLATIIPEMSKNRSLQRLTNEIQLQIRSYR